MSTFEKLADAVDRLRAAANGARGRSYPPAQIIAMANGAKADIDAITTSIVQQVQADIE